jgi:hypothetical protein
MQMPKMNEKGAQRIYSINEGYARNWDKATSEYVNSKKFPEVKKRLIKFLITGFIRVKKNLLLIVMLVLWLRMFIEHLFMVVYLCIQELKKQKMEKFV